MKAIGMCGSPWGEATRTMRLVRAVLRGAEGKAPETEFRGHRAESPHGYSSRMDRGRL